MKDSLSLLRWLIALCLAAASAGASAADTLKLAIGQRGNWGKCRARSFGQKAGFFCQARPDAGHPLYPGRRARRCRPSYRGAWISVSASAPRARSARSRRGRRCARSPTSMTGADDLFWYGTCPWLRRSRTLKDASGKTIAYSTNGSSSNWAVLAFIREFGVQMKPTATGGPAATFTQAMSGQVDIVVVVAAVRRRGAAAGPHPHRRARKRCALLPQPDRPADDHQHRDRGAAARRNRALPAGLSRHDRLDVFLILAARQSLRRMGRHFEAPRETGSRSVFPEGQSQARSAFGTR